MEINHGRGYVYALEYHIVWCVKYRRKIIFPDIHSTLQNYLSYYSEKTNFRILEFNTDKDHVHLLVSTTPQFSIPEMIKGMKGGSARIIMKQYPNLKRYLWGGHLWNPSYFVATVSDTTEEQISQYIKSQGRRKQDHDYSCSEKRWNV